MNKEYDVVIIGAGPVGLTCALELNRQGITNIIVLEKEQDLSPYAKASNIHCGTYDMLLNYPDLIERIDPEINLLKYFNFEEIEGDHLKNVNKISVVNKVDHKAYKLGMYMHGQYRTQMALLDVLSKRGVEVKWGVNVTDFLQDEDGVAVTFNEDTVRAKYLVGADGGRSFVRKKLDVKWNGSPIDDLRLIVCHLEVEHMDPLELEHGYVLTAKKPIDMFVLPMLDNHLYLGMPLTIEESKIFETELDHHGRMNVRQPTEEEMLVLMKDLLKLKNFVIKQIKWSSIFRFSSFVAEEYLRGRVAIVGDACHTHPPIGGRGMNTGIQDAINLGWKLALTLQGFQGVGGYRLLQSYHDERHPIGKALCDTTHKGAQKIGWLESVGSFMKKFLTGVAKMIPSSIISGGNLSETLMYGNVYRDSLLSVTKGYTTGECIVAGDRVTMGITKIRELCVNTSGFKLLILLEKHVELEFICCLYDMIAGGRFYITDSLIYTASDKNYYKIMSDSHIELEEEETIDLLKVYGVYSTGLFLIRPDNHIAYRSEPVDLQTLNLYLNKYFRRV